MNRKLPKNEISAELLLEIGTEEIPASYLASLGYPYNSLADFAQTRLEMSLDIKLDKSNFKSYQTPRRIILHVSGLPDSSEKKEEIVGPKTEICYQSDGQPTATLQGFLKSKQATLKDVREEKGRVVIRRTKKVVTRAVLKEILPECIRSLGFPKMMHWDENGIRFPRPIRWVLCLLNGKVFSFPLKAYDQKPGGLEANDQTFGWGPFKNRSKKIRHWRDYEAFLKKEGVRLEACAPGRDGERKSFIRAQVVRQIKGMGGSPAHLDENLLSEVNNLVEKPVVFSGHFDKKFLFLPKEVLIASMSKYQRVFSVENQKGELLPNFIACADGAPSVEKVKKNYEHVLNARLEDAKFFYEQDTKEAFLGKREKLKLLIYHQSLGTMFEKSERMKKLAEHLASRLPLDANRLIRACEFAKNDLVTEMVKEFPSLQGVIGDYYARKAGEGEDVALAVREQYLPKGDMLQELLQEARKRGSEGLPESDLGAAVSLLEKLDHVVGCFVAGESPTSSSDPYGLRRAANAVFRIILDRRWKFSLREIIEENAKLLNRPQRMAQGDRKGRLFAFLKDRLKGIFKERKYREDLIE
ncbi:MAG: glycine--tRNA ligase subunit beta, partial [Candidatus Omnitrophota bacterium]